MNWFNFFDNNTQELKHSFGRGINANISKDEENLFNLSYESFENGDIINGYDYFLKSLENFSNEIPNGNIITSKEEDKLIFTIYQGLAKITGYVTKEHLYAQSVVCKKESSPVALKRYILERNYQLTYANYCSDNSHLKLKLYLDNITINPHKIFFPLRELALNADYDKEFAKSEFKDISLDDIEHLTTLDSKELEIKYNYLHTLVEKVYKKIKTFPSNDNAGMQAFSYLYLLFKIDYLLVPKYNIYQKMSKKINVYFNSENGSIEFKNEELREYLNSLTDMNFNEFSQNFYNSKYTFSQTEKTSQEDINIFITESLKKIRWYKNNRYTQIIPMIYKYIVFYIVYNYGLHPVTKALFHTLIEIQNPDFFELLEYKTLYNEETNVFAKKTIISKIENIIEPYQDKFKLLEPFGDELNFSSLNEFSNSFYQQIMNLNFEEI